MTSGLFQLYFLKASEIENVICFKVGLGLFSARYISQGLLLNEYRIANWVSSGDNSNIVSARVARENFNVPLVVARIYDPRRAKVYERLGIPTVASVAWTTDQVLRRLLPLGAQEEWRDPSGNVVLAQVYLSPKWIGKRVGDLSEAAKVRVALISRFGGAILPDRDTVLQEGDLIHVTVRDEDIAKVEEILARSPEDHS